MLGLARSAWAGLAALVAFAAGLTSIFLALAQRDGGGGAAPREVAARLRVEKADDRVLTAREFLLENHQPAPGDPGLEREGRAVHLGLELRGLEHEKATLRWTLIPLVPDLPRYRTIRRQSVLAIESRAPVYRRVAAIWFPHHPRERRFFARVELLFDKDVLAFVDTKSYVVPPPPAGAPPAAPRTEPPPPKVPGVLLPE